MAGNERSVSTLRLVRGSQVPEVNINPLLYHVEHAFVVSLGDWGVGELCLHKAFPKVTFLEPLFIIQPLPKAPVPVCCVSSVVPER